MDGRSALAREPIRTIARRALLLALVWLVLSSAEPSGLLVGAAATAAATWLSYRLRPERPQPVNVARAARLLPRFLWRSVLGGVDVARRALDPRLPLAPGWFVLPAHIPEGNPRVILGGELSLLPGTLVAGTRNGRFLVHVLDRDRPVAQDVANEEAALRTAIEEPRQ